MTKEQVVERVLSGSLGNGDERKKNIEKLGYSYNEIQDVINERVKKEEPVATSSEKSYISSNKSSEMYPKSINILGNIFPVNNTSSQARLDERDWEMLAWDNSRKLNGDGTTMWLANHQDSYGGMFYDVYELTYMDANGVEQTYSRVKTLGPMAYTSQLDWDDEWGRPDIIHDEDSDYILIQTCVPGTRGERIIYFLFEPN